MTSSCVCCASRPVLAIHRDLTMAVPKNNSKNSNLQELRRRLGIALGVLEELHMDVELALPADHLDERIGHVDVAALEVTRREAHFRVGVGARAAAHAKKAVRAALELRFL